MIIVMLLVLLVSVGFILFTIIRRITMPKEKLEQIRAENAVKAEEARKTLEESRAARKRWKAIQEERKLADKTPVSVKLLYVQNEYGKRAMGTAARGLIGAAVAGTFGAAVGIASGRAQERVKSATFAVKYASGRKGNETVTVNSARFKELSGLLID